MASIDDAGRRGKTLVTVNALANRRKGSDFRMIPSFYWREPAWSVSRDGLIAYLVPDTLFRVELYAENGAPTTLVTGRVQNQDTSITEADIQVPNPQ